MSDPTKQTLAEKERLKLLDTRDKSPIEPVPKDPKLFAWLEKLFDGAQFPEMLACRVVSGPNYVRLGPMIKQVTYPPKAVKPSKEDLVAFSNELIGLMQRDADIQRKRVVYALLVSHKLSDPDYFERYLYPREPTLVHQNDGIPRPDDGESDHGTRQLEMQYVVQMMNHHQQMFALYGGGFEGLLDRMDRVNEQQARTIDTLREKNEKLMEMTERALSLEEDRREKREWNALKVRGVEKILDLGMALAPPLLNQLAGKKLLDTNDSAEAVTLRNFFQSEQQGGRLSEQQALLAFGDGKGQAGVLSLEQTKLLLDVAYLKVPSDELNKVLPGGPLEITQDQQFALITRCGFSMEQLAPIKLLLETRTNQRQKS